MCVNRDNREGAISGNTNSEIAEVKVKQPNQALNWCFTYNNYKIEEIEILSNKFNEICKRYCFQQEVGENGTHHLQGVISLYTKSRWTEFKLPKEIHWEVCKNVEKSYKYCSKEQTRFGKIFTKGYNPIEILHADNFYDWQKFILNILNSKPHPRKVYWFYDIKGGCGKSSFCKYLAYHELAIVCNGGKSKDLINLIYNSNMETTNAVIWDIARCNGNSVSYNALENIKNGLICNTKYETGTKIFNCPHIIIFSNDKPEVKNLSEDRWEIYEIQSTDGAPPHKSPASDDTGRLGANPPHPMIDYL